MPFRPTAERGSTGRMDEGQGEAFVGRQSELARLEQTLGAAASGRGQVVLIKGEPGAGKTRLAKELSVRASARGFTVAWGRCWEGEDAPRYWPWRQIVDGLPGDDAGNASSGSLEDPDHFSVADRIVNVLARLDRPTLFVLDDLHAADESSLHTLRAIAQQIEKRSVLLLGTYREDDVEAGSVAARALISIERMSEAINLRGLSDDDAALCFAQVAGYPPPRSLASSVYVATNGNPFFVRELARDAGGEHGIHRPDRSVGFRVPTGARDLITQRLDRLPDHLRSLLRAGAAIGYEFDALLLERVTAGERERLLDGLSDAVRRGFLEERSALGRYAFSHVLVREALYEELSASERGRLHAEAAHAIEALYPKDIDLHVGELAHHYFKAGTMGDLGKALGHGADAGRRALDHGDFDEASRQLYRALKVAQETGQEESVREELTAMLAEAEAAARETAEAMAPTETREANSLTREGEYWAITFAGATTRLKDSKGLRYLAELVRSPGREFLALDLVATAGAARTNEGAARAAGLTPGRDNADEVLDAEAKARYRQRLEVLRDEIEEAESFNDPERAARAKEEMEFLARELAARVGLGGRARKASSATDRARMSVTRALRTAIDRIAESNPVLGRHLEATIKTGTYVSYTPDPRVPVDWKL